MSGVANSVQERLGSIREALLHLHKALIESERVTYEATVGKIRSPNHFLQLLTTDPWFAWLHPISQLIVAMDEALDEKDTVLTAPVVDGFYAQTKALLVPSETGEGFAKHYFEALQRDPDVVLAHGAVMGVVAPSKKTGS